MATASPLFDWNRGFGNLQVVEKSLKVGPGSLKIYHREVRDFLDAGKLADISFAELARVKVDEFTYKNLTFILPSVTISSTKLNYEDFLTLVRLERYLWYHAFRSRIGNKGMRQMKSSIGKQEVRILFSGIWVIESSIFLNPLVEMTERVRTWATSL
jgi:hypothetical protein